MSTSDTIPNRARIIAFCGTDGAGKSTLATLLEEDVNSNDFVFVRKSNSMNQDRIRRQLGVPSVLAEWQDGTFARNNAISSTLDFLVHYYENIEPLLMQERVIVCDRYKPCWLAYGSVVPAVKEDICSLLSHIPDPDLVVYVDCEPTTKRRRLLARCETTVTAEVWAEGYDLVLSSYRHVLRVWNSDEIDLVYAELKKQLDRYIYKWNTIELI